LTPASRLLRHSLPADDHRFVVRGCSLKGSSCSQWRRTTNRQYAASESLAEAETIPALSDSRAAKAAILKTPLESERNQVPDGFDGLIRPEKLFELTLDRVSRILPRGGTILGTTNRRNPFKYRSEENGQEVERDICDDILANRKNRGIEPSSPSAVTAGRRLATNCSRRRKLLACPRRSTMICRLPTSRSGSTRLYTRSATPSTRSTPPRRRVTASGRGSHGP
jgi:hypothetical protein